MNIHHRFVAPAVCAALLAACSRGARTFGPDYNPTRDSLGIPALPADWSTRASGRDLNTWTEPRLGELQKKRTPFHASKEVYTPGNLPGYELDTYYGAQPYQTVDGTFIEHVTLEYFFRPMPERGSAPAGWRCRVTDALHPDGASITLRQADSILAAWGLSRTR
jgi:hypothetical protein